MFQERKVGVVKTGLRKKKRERCDKGRESRRRGEKDVTWVIG